MTILLAILLALDPCPPLTLTGIASHMGSAAGDRYLALPDGPGHRVTVCGPVGCITATSNDAGPSLAMQRAGRIADLSRAYFRRVCGDPRLGLCRVTVQEVVR